MRMSRGFTRTTRKPSRLSSAGRERSWPGQWAGNMRLFEASPRSFRPRCEIAARCAHAVAAVVLMRHVAAGHQDRLLQFTRLAHFCRRAERCRRPDVAVPADLGLGTDDRRAFDVSAP